MATEVIDTNENYRTDGTSIQTLDDNKAIDLLETMESHNILKNFPSDRN